MFFTKYYRRLIQDIKKSALDEELRYQIQYRYILKILLVVVLIAALINLLTERYTMGILMIILGGVYFGFYWIVYILKNKGVQIVNWLMIISSIVICTEIMIHGTTGGVAPVWILLFPMLSMLLLGRKKGVGTSMFMLLIIMFLFWTPFGHDMLRHRYDIIFMERYPFVYMVVFVVALFNETVRSTMVAELQNRQEQMESVYQNQYHSMESRIAEARKIRHDLRHHFVMISQYMKDGQIEEAQAYIDQYYKALPFEEALIYCQHYATNALLTYYGQIAKENDIAVDIQLNMPAEVAIKTDDLTVVFGNLLENAVHANLDGIKESKDFTPWIKIMGNYDGNALTLNVKNASLHEAKMNDKNMYISTKHEGTGIGVRSVQDMVEKYNGVFRVDQPKGEYSTSLVMYSK